MGVEYGAKLIVGLPYEELEHLGEDFVDDLGLDYASPYFDADHECWIVGVDVEAIMYGAIEVDPTLVNGLTKKAAKEFTKKTGMVGKLYLSSHGW